jgi:hypothetical protein
MATPAIAPATTSTLPPELEAAAQAAAGKRAARAVGRAVADGILEAVGKRSAAAAGGAPEASAAEPSSASASAKASTTTTTTLPKELDFLKDPKLSVQEKVFRFLLYLQDKADRELEAKLKEMAPKSTTTTRKERKGWLGDALGWIGKAVPGIGISLELLESPQGRALLKQISGPVLAAAATAMGAPQLAPVLMQMGPQIVDGAARAAGATTTSTSTTQSEASTNDQRQIIELQHLMEKQRTTIQLLSNVLRVMDETTGAVVANIR